MIQGTGVAGCGWSPQVEGLKNDYPLAWFDNRGMGDSPGLSSSLEGMADDAISVLDALQWPDAHVVGHSLGGVIAQALAVGARERVTLLALLCTLINGRASVGLSPRRALAQFKTVVGTRDMRRRAFFDLVYNPEIPATEENMSALEHVFGRSLKALPRAANRQVQILMGTNMSKALADLTSPAFILSATHDLIATVGQGRALAAALDAAFVEVPGGHAVAIHGAARINAAFARFWRQVDGIVWRGEVCSARARDTADTHRRWRPAVSRSAAH